ncbi:protein NPGR1 [Senna tora]|uniref:Protein NPGR1 n=1 Tax=Senna tora TaxID=362788 RepID=A0A834T937_9FABA|nr:protein NPGR1 [Senna tora]
MDAETIVDFSLNEAGRMDQLRLLRLKAVLQIAQQQPKQTMDIHRKSRLHSQHISTAELLLKLGMQSLPIARSFLMNALRLEPTNYLAWFNLGLVSKFEGSLQQAADFFQAAYELKLSSPVQKFK